ncbi:hypothetical protein V6N13_031426 [Hibiscus sabdariffa]|uniref:Uncharacterized protein n=1 Tax=Hibiscus sabdariffa TaxID=183260 RepID=A0ABR2CKC3_9ROSI
MATCSQEREKFDGKDRNNTDSQDKTHADSCEAAEIGNADNNVKRLYLVEKFTRENVASHLQALILTSSAISTTNPKVIKITVIIFSFLETIMLTSFKTWSWRRLHSLILPSTRHHLENLLGVNLLLFPLDLDPNLDPTICCYLQVNQTGSDSIDTSSISISVATAGSWLGGEKDLTAAELREPAAALITGCSAGERI